MGPYLEEVVVGNNHSVFGCLKGITRMTIGVVTLVTARRRADAGISTFTFFAKNTQALTKDYGTC